MAKSLGIAWLKANDPTYVSPAMKAAETKRTEWNIESALAYAGGDGCYKASKTGKRLALNSSFCVSGSEGNYSLEVEDNNSPESALEEKQESARFTGTKRGRRGGKKNKRKV